METKQNKTNKNTPPFEEDCAEAVIYDCFLCMKNDHVDL